MREDQVSPAAMNIDGRSQVLDGHRAAFDVPPWPPHPPGAVPGRLAGFLRLPESEIRRVLFPFVDFHSGAGYQTIQVAMAELPVIFVSVHTEIHVAGDGISVALFN